MTAELMETYRVGLLIGLLVGVVMTLAVQEAWRERGRWLGEMRGNRMVRVDDREPQQ